MIRLHPRLSNFYVGFVDADQSPPSSPVWHFFGQFLSGVILEASSIHIRFGLSFSISSTAHPSPSLLFIHSCLLFSLQVCAPLTIYQHFSGYLNHFRRPTNSSVPNSVPLCASTHPSQHPHLRHIQFFLFPFLHCLHLCRSYCTLVYFPLTFKLILRSRRTPDTLSARN